MTRSSPRATTRMAQAQILRALETTWRNWRAFVAEKKDEIAHRQADAAGIDDLTLPVGSPAARPKSRIGAAARQELALILEQRRQAAQRDAEAAARAAAAPLPDVEQVLERLIQRIDDELHGRVLANGNALVWFEGQLVEFDYRVVSSGTTDDEYLAASGIDPDAERRRKQIVITVAAIAALGLVLALTGVFGGGESTASASGPTLAQVGDQTPPLWDIQEVAVAGARAADPGAALGSPTLVCLTGPQREALAPGATITITGTASVRTYTAHADAAAAPRDLIVADCGQTPPALLASAALRDAATSQALDPQLVAAVTTTGSDNDPATIPADRMRVTVTLARPGAQQATLLLADGTRWSPTDAQEVGETTVLTYLVPLAQGPQPAGVEVPGAPLPGRLALTLPAPQARQALLRQRLTVTASGAEVGERNGSPILTLTLVITLDESASPITLLPTDLALTRSGADRPAEWEPPALTPGTSATVRIVVPLDDAAPPVEAALGAWRARLRW